MATRKRTTRSRTQRSELEDILSTFTRNTRSKSSSSSRRRKGTLSSITGGKKAASSILLTLAAICFAVGYYVDSLYFLTYVGLALGVIYLLVTYFKNRKKDNGKQTTADQSAPKPTTTRATAQTQKTESAPQPQAAQTSYISASQRQQILNQLNTNPQLQPINPLFADAAKVIVNQQNVNVPLLTQVLSATPEQMDNILLQLSVLGIISSPDANGHYTVFLSSDNELAEWLQLIFS